MLAWPAAIKLIRPAIAGDARDGVSEAARKRFEREAQAIASLRSPHTIALYDFGVTNDQTLYLVMELLDGLDLELLVRKSGPLPAARVVHILRQVCESLEEAHAAGLVHRDIKPANIHLGTLGLLRDFVKVLDFGIAKLAEAQTHQTMTGALMGTPLYMAPEQARSAGTIDHRADLYSLGCIFYELVAGRPPLVGEGAGEIIAMHMFTVPEPPSRFVDALHPEIERVILRLLEKEPADRFAHTRFGAS